MLGAAPLAEREGVIHLSGPVTNPEIAFAGVYVFRTVVSEARLGIDTGNICWADGICSIATIIEATDYAEGALRTTVAQCDNLGGAVEAASIH